MRLRFRLAPMFALAIVIMAALACGGDGDDPTPTPAEVISDSGSPSTDVASLEVRVTDAPPEGVT